MRVKDYKLTPKWRGYIADLAWDFLVNEERLLRGVVNPFGTNDDFGREPFPAGHSDYLRRFKNMRYYILDSLQALLRTAHACAGAIDKKSLKDWDEKLETVKRLKEEAKKEKA